MLLDILMTLLQRRGGGIGTPPLQERVFLALGPDNRSGFAGNDNRSGVTG
jgi:hypothetical protein